MLSAETKSSPETRVWGFPPGNRTGIGSSCWVTSTSRWGSWYRYAGTVSARLVQRYYSYQIGRFLTPDPYVANDALGDPQSWNRYAYVGGDPINFYDRSGMNRASVEHQVCFYDEAYGDYHCANDITAGGGPSSPPDIPEDGFSSRGRGATPPVRVENYSTTSTAAIAVQNVLRWLREGIGLDDTCDRWLRNSGTTIDFLLGQAPGWTTMFAGVANFPADPNINAVAGVTGTTLAAGTSGLVVNVSGGFFNSSGNAGLGTNIQGGTDAAKAFILLHELAHLTGAPGFLSNDRNDEAQRANNAMVLENCGRTVSRAAGVLP